MEGWQGRGCGSGRVVYECVCKTNHVDEAIVAQRHVDDAVELDGAGVGRVVREHGLDRASVGVEQPQATIICWHYIYSANVVCHIDRRTCRVHRQPLAPVEGVGHVGGVADVVGEGVQQLTGRRQDNNAAAAASQRVVALIAHVRVAQAVHRQAHSLTEAVRPIAVSVGLRERIQLLAAGGQYHHTPRPVGVAPQAVIEHVYAAVCIHLHVVGFVKDGAGGRGAGVGNGEHQSARWLLAVRGLQLLPLIHVCVDHAAVVASRQHHLIADCHQAGAVASGEGVLRADVDPRVAAVVAAHREERGGEGGVRDERAMRGEAAART